MDTELNFPNLYLSDDEKEALIDLFNEAWGDQRHYLDTGNSTADYGDEWQLVAQEKAERFNLGAAVLDKIGASELAKSCRALAEDFADESVSKVRDEAE